MPSLPDHPAVVLRVDEPLAVRLPSPRAGQTLHSLTGKGTRLPVWDRDREAYLLPRHHAESVVLGLATHYGAVTVWQYGDAAVICAGSCQSAQSSVLACECSCTGAGHGLERRPLPGDVAAARTSEQAARPGIAGAFSHPGFTAEEAAQARAAREEERHAQLLRAIEDAATDVNLDVELLLRKYVRDAEPYDDLP